MATIDPKDDRPTVTQKVVAVWRAPARLAALAAVLGALVTFSPPPADAIGAAVTVLVAWELGRKK